MVWFKVDDGMHRSRKVLAIPRRHRLGAVGLFTMAGSWCADEETDGVFPDFMLGEWGATQALVDALLRSGLWAKVPDSSDERSTNERRVLDEQATGTRFTKWSEYQPTRSELLEKRAKTAEKLRNWRGRNQVGNPVGNPVTDSVTDPVTNPVSNPAPDPTRPDPTNKKKRAASGADAATQEQQVTEAAYEACGKAFNFIATRQIVKWAIHDRSEPPARVEAALVGVHEMGKPITKQTIGQWLDGNLQTPGARPRSRRDGRGNEQWMYS